MCLLFHLFCTFKNKREPNKGIRLKGVFIHQVLNNALASRSSVNFDFVLVRTADFDKSVILLFLVFTTFSFLTFVFSSTIQIIR